MKIVMYVFVFVAVVCVAGAAYVRLAPTDVARWHQPVEASESADMAGGAIRVITADAAAFDRVDAAARALPRTTVLAGSVAEGRITYVTRSAAIGFPDFTTIEYSDGQIKMFARLRFGQSDMGVNAKRLEGLLGAIQG